MRLNELMKLRECGIRWKREGQEGVAYLPRGVWSHPTLSTNQIHFQITHNFGIGSCTFSNLGLAQTVCREKVDISIYTHVAHIRLTSLVGCGQGGGVHGVQDESARSVAPPAHSSQPPLIPAHRAQLRNESRLRALDHAPLYMYSGDCHMTSPVP